MFLRFPHPVCCPLMFTLGDNHRQRALCVFLCVTYNMFVFLVISISANGMVSVSNLRSLSVSSNQ